MRVFIGMETSGVSRRAFQACGHSVVSADRLPAEDGSRLAREAGTHRFQGHYEGDVFDCLDMLAACGEWPDLAIFHPDCTYHTVSAAWAFCDPDYERYPGVGYHQKVEPGTLVGAARRERREQDEEDVRRIVSLPIHRKAIENPRGTLSTRVLGQPQQVFQPNFSCDSPEGSRGHWLQTHLHHLRGKNLACWCKLGEPCHADVLLELANPEPQP